MTVMLIVYNGESGLDVYNNPSMRAAPPAPSMRPRSTWAQALVFQSIRNNLFTSFNTVKSNFGSAFVSTPDGARRRVRV
jgi:hypothetical protein